MSRGNVFFIRIDDFSAARGDDPALRFQGESPQALAGAIQAALATPDLFQRWRAAQAEPDEVDDSLAPVDAESRVEAQQADLGVDLTITTSLSMRIVRHRLGLLIGPHWTLRDVRAA